MQFGIEGNLLKATTDFATLQPGRLSNGRLVISGDAQTPRWCCGFNDPEGDHKGLRQRPLATLEKMG